MTRAFHFMSSNTVMNVEAGAKVVFNDDWTKYKPQSGELITAKNLYSKGVFNNIGLIGGGIIDGQGQKWWAKREKKWRPRQVYFKGKNCLIQGLTFRNSPNHVLQMRE